MAFFKLPDDDTWIMDMYEERPWLFYMLAAVLIAFVYWIVKIIADGV